MKRLVALLVAASLVAMLVVPAGAWAGDKLQDQLRLRDGTCGECPCG